MKGITWAYLQGTEYHEMSADGGSVVATVIRDSADWRWNVERKYTAVCEVCGAVVDGLFPRLERAKTAAQRHWRECPERARDKRAS